MSLKDLALTSDATIVVTPGNGALTLKTDAVQIPNGVHLVVAEDVHPKTRRTITAKYRDAQLNTKTGRYGKIKREIVIVLPTESIDGAVVEYNLARIFLENSPNTAEPNVDLDKLIRLIVQTLTDPEAKDFLEYGTLS